LFLICSIDSGEWVQSQAIVKSDRNRGDNFVVGSTRTCPILVAHRLSASVSASGLVEIVVRRVSAAVHKSTRL
jgi:hypothetical protein